MKCLWMLVLCGGLFFASRSNAESISEQLKAADCSFRIQYKGKDVQVLDQKITLRAAVEHRETVWRNASQAISGAGYRSYHLEIAYTGKHIDVPHSIRRADFLTDQRKRIHTVSLASQVRTMSESERGKKLDVRYLSINLEGIPLVLLDDVVIIDFTQ